MRIRLDLKSRVLLLAFSGILVISSVQILQQYREFQKRMDISNAELFTQLEETLTLSIKSELDYLSLAVRTLVQNPRIVELFAKGQREELAAFLGDYQKVLKNDYGIAQFQFHTPPATSFLRMHLPSQFGDDLSAFRTTVIEANRQRRPVIGLEVGVGGPGTRVVYPLEWNGGHIGSVEFGGSIDWALASLRDTFTVEYAVGIQRAVFANANRVVNEKDVILGDMVYYPFSSADARLLTTKLDDAAIRSARVGPGGGNHDHPVFRDPLVIQTGPGAGPCLGNPSPRQAGQQHKRWSRGSGRRTWNFGPILEHHHSDTQGCRCQSTGGKLPGVGQLG